MLLEWAMLNTVLRRCVFPSPYFPLIIIPLDFPCSQTVSSRPEISFMILGRASEKYCPTAREGMPERSASMICLASISYIGIHLLHSHLNELRDAYGSGARLLCDPLCGVQVKRSR